MSKTVKLKQKQDDWQSKDPITIAGITHYKEQGDTANWKGIPAAGGECEVYYDSAAAVIVFDWKGKSTAGSTINWNEESARHTREDRHFTEPEQKSEF